MSEIVEAFLDSAGVDEHTDRSVRRWIGLARREGEAAERTACAELVREFDADDLARMFHEAYEDLAPRFGYETRPESRKRWEDVPDKNRCLMRATVSKVARALAAAIEERK